MPIRSPQRHVRGRLGCVVSDRPRDIWRSHGTRAQRCRVLPNAASVNERGGIHRAAVEVNQLGSFLALRFGARHLAGSGSIVLFSSTAAHAPSGLDLVPYTATKWAVRGMAHSAAIELAELGIRVNAIAPGAVRTPMITSTLSDEALMNLANRVPLGRLGEPNDIAPLVVYLVSDESAYCTGADFVIDGGMTAGAFHRPEPLGVGPRR